MATSALSGKANGGGLIMSCAPLQITRTSVHDKQQQQQRQKVSGSN